MRRGFLQRGVTKLVTMVAVVACIVGLDQLTKACVLHLHAQNMLPLPVTSFFTLRLVWNRGISFGLFNDGSTPWWLYLMIGCLVGVLLVMVWRNRRTALVWPLIMVVGGALGNVIDRVRFQAVVDFLDFYIPPSVGMGIGGYHWPAFNVADAAITVGGLWLFVKLWRQT